VGDLTLKGCDPMQGGGRGAQKMGGQGVKPAPAAKASAGFLFVCRARAVGFMIRRTGYCEPEALSRWQWPGGILDTMLRKVP
jgi:hypothetical protein